MSEKKLSENFVSKIGLLSSSVICDCLQFDVDVGIKMTALYIWFRNLLYKCYSRINSELYFSFNGIIFS